MTSNKHKSLFLYLFSLCLLVLPVFASAAGTPREQILALLKLIAARQNQNSANPLVLGPIARSISGPSELRVNENGHWTLTATDRQDSPLTYRMDWGDGSANFTLAPARLLGQHEQLITFNHTYKAAGKYLLKASATNLAQQSGSATFLLEVE